MVEYKAYKFSDILVVFKTNGNKIEIVYPENLKSNVPVFESDEEPLAISNSLTGIKNSIPQYFI